MIGVNKANSIFYYLLTNISDYFQTRIMIGLEPRVHNKSVQTEVEERNLREKTYHGKSACETRNSGGECSFSG